LGPGDQLTPKEMKKKLKSSDYRMHQFCIFHRLQVFCWSESLRPETQHVC